MRHAGIFVFWAVLLHLSFAYDVFSVFGGPRSLYVGPDSYLALNRLALDERHDVGLLHPMPRQINDPKDPSAPRLDYHSQFGLPGVVLNAVAHATGADRMRIGIAAAQVCCFLTAALLSLFLVSVGLRHGRFTAGVTAVLLALSYQLIYLVPSIYWCCFLSFGPFVFTWLFGERLLASKRGVCLLALVNFLLTFLKCLCGYEFVTTVLLSPLPAMVYHLCRSGAPLRRGLLPSLMVVMAGCGGFAAALGAHSAQLHFVAKVDAKAAIMNRLQHRCGHAIEWEYADKRPEAFGPLSAEVVYGIRAFIKYFNMPAFRAPLPYPLGFWCPVWVFVALMGMLSLVGLMRRKTMPLDQQALIRATLVALGTSLSWQFAALNHMVWHFHLNLLVFHLPFLPLAYVLLGDLLQRCLGRWNVEPMAIATVLLGVAVVIGVQQDQRAKHQLETAAIEERLRELFARQLSGTGPFNEQFLAGVEGFDPAGDWCLDVRLSALRHLYPGGGSSGAHLIHGWAYDRTADTRPVRIVVTVGDKIIAQTTTGLAAPHVAITRRLSHYGAAFSVAVPFRPGDEKLVRIFAVPPERDELIQEIPVSQHLRGH